MDIERADSETPCIDITVRPSTSIPARGQFDVELPGGLTLSREIDLGEHDRHVLAIVLPPSVATREEIPVRVSSPLLDGDRQTRIAGWSGTDAPTASSRQSTPQTETTQRTASRQPAQNDPRQSGNTGSDQAADQDEKPRVSVERKLPETAECGVRFTERLRVTNESRRPAEDVTVADASDNYHIDRIEAESSVVLTRYHTLFETGEHRLPPVDAAQTRSRQETIRIAEPEIWMQAAPVDGDTLGLEIANDSRRRCTLTRIAVKTTPDDDSETHNFEEPPVVEAGEQETVTRQFDRLADAGRVTSQILVEYRHGNSTEQRLTLAPRVETGDSATQGSIEATLLDKSRLVAETQGVVEVAVENDTALPFRDATLSVEGDIVLDTALSQDSKTVSAFEPGTTETLLVDVMPESAEQETFDVVVEGTVDGEQVTERQTFAGPVAEAGERWERENYLAEWETNDDDTAVRVGETHLTTQFRPTEAGNRR
ncbi:hypothetical protein [Halovenus salina]|uniref:Uncharacterized protein n=1 Tax=Halovenus salina TaxID=1510225 RepID=A0ABD5W2V0_9EURY